ncbi:dipeptidase PepV [Metabacillus fastidiosus]|uniref:dipeptidase PepV n=1 Tax=Metabacillus fastidiosus TaxID=1458 RepID=UPI003D2C58A7
MDWKKEVQKRKESLISDTQEFLQIKSVLDEDSKSDHAPFGEEINKALNFLLEQGQREGFTVKNLDGYAAHIEFGKGEEIVGILCHIDVVPEGDGWMSDPFGAEIRDGKIYARGALDDKGPTMAAFYAMKIVKDLGLSLNKRVRMIIGTDEESDWRCVDHYFKHEEMPALGFAPDADFPIIFAEKGIIDAKLIAKKVKETNTDIVLKSFHSGRRFNMVPDYAEAKLLVNDKNINVSDLFANFLGEFNINGEINTEDKEIIVQIKGVSAHAMEPDNGVNAGILLAMFLKRVFSNGEGHIFINEIVEKFANDTRGVKLHIVSSDEISGELTVNLGIISYEAGEEGYIGVNIRYPVTGDSKAIKEKLGNLPYFELTEFNDSKPHHVDAGHPLIKTLQKVYENQTGEKAELISIGGGTYARSLQAGVAFGPLFPGRPDIAHQKDEYIEMEDLLKAASIYAEAIYELAK